MANCFAKADTGKTRKIPVEHPIKIFEANNCTLEEEDLEKISELEDDSGEISRDKYWNFVWNSRFWKTKLAAKGPINKFNDRRLKIEEVLRCVKKKC